MREDSLGWDIFTRFRLPNYHSFLGVNNDRHVLQDLTFDQNVGLADWPWTEFTLDIL